MSGRDPYALNLRDIPEDEWETIYCPECGCGWSTVLKAPGDQCLDYGTCEGILQPNKKTPKKKSKMEKDES